MMILLSFAYCIFLKGMIEASKNGVLDKVRRPGSVPTLPSVVHFDYVRELN